MATMIFLFVVCGLCVVGFLVGVLCLILSRCKDDDGLGFAGLLLTLICAGASVGTGYHACEKLDQRSAPAKVEESPK